MSVREYPYYIWLIFKHYLIFWFLWLPFILWECVKEGKPWMIPVIGFFHVLYSPLMVFLEADKEFKSSRD